MLIPLSFLQRYFSRELNAEKIAGLLTSAGLEIEHIIAPKPLGQHVVIGEVQEVSQHPHADRLKVCKVNCGKSELLTIVCGAPNVAKGQRVVVALVGATLPNGMAIKETTIRGVMSQGMICAEDELGISANHHEILVLSSDAPIGSTADAYGLVDTILEAEVTPNRPDWLSIRGIARELGALLKQPAKLTQAVVKESASPIQRTFRISVGAKTATQYHGRLLSGITATETPFCIRRQLMGYGIMSQHPVVDVTNLILFEDGQPLHAFDADAIAGKTVYVRFAKKGERFEALDGATYALLPEDIVIADSKKILALAGIIGGKSSAITAATKQVFLESAIFPQQAIRHTSRRLGLRTEAANRFERGIPPDLPIAASNHAAQLIADLTHAEVHKGILSFTTKRQPRKVLRVTASEINGLLGSHLLAKAMAEHLVRLGFSVRVQKEVLTVTTPDWRQDIFSMADIAEEVARMHGYEKLPLTLPVVAQHVPIIDSTLVAMADIRRTLLRMGYSELVLESWYGDRGLAHATLPKDAHCEIRNPLQQEQRYLRTDLLPGLLTICRSFRKQEANVKLFECGQVFWKKLNPPAKDWRVGFVVSLDHRSSWIEAERDVSVFLQRILHRDEREIYLGAGSHARDIRIGTVPVGHMVIKPLAKGALAACVEFDLAELLPLRKPLSLPNLSKFPNTYRDFAVAVPQSMDTFTLIRQLRHASHLISSCELFDVMPQDNRISYAFHLAFTASDRTLTSQEVDVELQSIRQACAEKGITVRS